MPVASASKASRPRGGKNRVGDNGIRKVTEIDRPPVTPLGRKIAMAFNWLQEEGVPMAKAIAKLRSIYNEAFAARDRTIWLKHKMRSLDNTCIIRRTKKLKYIRTALSAQCIFESINTSHGPPMHACE